MEHLNDREAFAKALVAAFEKAVLDMDAGDQNGGVLDHLLLRREQARADLIQALLVPDPKEVDDYPTVFDLAAIAALQGFCTNRGPVEAHYENNGFAALEQAKVFMAMRARLQGGDHA